ncbi:hypothetical protein [Sphingobium sp.]|uniref:hypothetical protein n=1 Tax=Sphingobium sp. TaxID=1912891 RepID=UPI002637D8E2|nr:hypothetical protein [Sphingobium sp.]
MSSEAITLTLAREEVAYLHRQAAAEALTYIGHAMRGALKPGELARKAWLVELSDKLAMAQGLR